MIDPVTIALFVEEILPGRSTDVEPARSICLKCGSKITQEVLHGHGAWVDNTGGDACWGDPEGNYPDDGVHEPF